MISFDQLVKLFEVLPGVLWPFATFAVVIIFRKRLSSIKVGDSEIVFREAIGMAAADKEFQKSEVMRLLSHAAIYGKTPKEVADSIISLSDIEGISIEEDARELLKRHATVNIS